MLCRWRSGRDVTGARATTAQVHSWQQPYCQLHSALPMYPCSLWHRSACDAALKLHSSDCVSLRLEHSLYKFAVYLQKLTLQPQRYQVRVLARLLALHVIFSGRGVEMLLPFSFFLILLSSVVLAEIQRCSCIAACYLC